MSRCIIHIGMHKTGSSSIQSSLEGFSDNTFYYAKLSSGPNHSVAMHSIFSDRPQRHHLHMGKKRADIDNYISTSRQSLEQSIKIAQGRILLISAESVSQLPYDNVKAIYKYLSKSFDEIKIVGYVRPPVALMTSIFQESLKGTANNHFDIERTYKGYRNTFSKFDDIFTPENVQLWKFEPQLFPDGCVVQDFCSRLGIVLPKQKIVRTNESLSLQAVSLLHIYRKFGMSLDSVSLRGQESMRLGNAIKNIGNDRFRFAPELMLPFLKKNSDDIQWMENRIGQSLEENLSQRFDTDINNETDLIQAGVDVVPQLLQLVGRPKSDHRLIRSPEAIAHLVGQLRQKIANKGISPFKVLIGRLGNVTTKQVNGWAIGINPSLPVRVKIKVNGKMVGEKTADLFRPGLKSCGFHPTGLCGFSYDFTEDYPLRVGDSVEVNPVDGSFRLANSPYLFSGTE